MEVKDGSNVVLKCEYDGLGRGTKKHINTGEDQTYDKFRHFYYNSGWQLLETRKSTSENTEPRNLARVRTSTATIERGLPKARRGTQRYRQS